MPRWMECRRCGAHAIDDGDSSVGGWMMGHVLACVLNHARPRNHLDALALVAEGIVDFLRACHVSHDYATGYARACMEIELRKPKPPRTVH